MSFQELQAKYRRHFEESTAWKLLRADNASYILAFIADMFSEESEISYGRAKIMLDAEIARSREFGIWETETPAGSYLNLWIRSGWLREMDDMITKTDASEIALRFCRGLEDRHTGTTASHLRIVQDAVRDLAVAMSADVGERVSLLENKKTEIQREIDALQAGDISELSESQQFERMREIYQLASILTGDFRRVEDEIRRLDKELRVQIIEEGATRGKILLSMMEKEHILSSTNAGSAFEGFFQLLCDQNRSTEFREQLRSILDQAIAKKLSVSQQHFLAHLMRELTRESDRVFDVRRRTEEGLRLYIESGAAAENRSVDLLLGKLEKLALHIRETEVSLITETSLSLPVGTIKIQSPDSIVLKSPGDELDTSGVEEKANTREPSLHILEQLDSVRVRDIAHSACSILREYGPMSISELANKKPLVSGLEELVAYLCVAKAVGATMIADKEKVAVMDKYGVELLASIPTYVLSADLFPEDMDELVL